MGKKKFSLFEVDISKRFPAGISTHVDWEPNTNIIEIKDRIVIEVELPGVIKEDVSIELKGTSELIIRGVKKQPRFDDDQHTYYLFEREFGSFFKKIMIGVALDTSTINSVMENGVLTIHIAKKKIDKISIEVEE